MERQQVFLSPGTYELGGGRRQVFTPRELRKIVSNTLDVQARGYQVPVLLGHPEPGSEAGSPRLDLSPSGEDDSAAAPRRVGRLEDVWQNDDGGLEFRLSLDDSGGEADAKLPEFTSPEIRRRFTLPDGTEVGPLIAHVALTDAPRNTRQEPLEALPEAVQFSLTDLVESLAERQASQREAYRRRIEASAHLPPALRERLCDVLETVQMSQDSDDEPALSLASVLQMLEETLPTVAVGPDSIQVARHPGGDTFFGQDAQQKTRDLVQRQLSQAGFLKA